MQMQIPKFVHQAREKTPESAKQLFFNSAGSSLISSRTRETIISYLDEEYRKGGYDVMMDYDDVFKNFYIQAAKLVNSNSRNIAFQTSATDAYSKVIYSIPWKDEDLILTTYEDYVSNVLTFNELQKRFGVRYEFCDTNLHGSVDLQKLENQLEMRQVRMLAITHVPTSNGMIQDAVSIGRLAKKYNVLYLLDACQSVGQLKVDVKEIQCDFLTVTGRKFLRGPRGTGFLFISDLILDQEQVPFCLDLAGAEWVEQHKVRFSDNAKRYEFWEKNYGNLLGLTQSITEINDIGIEAIADYNHGLQAYFRSKLQEIPGLILLDQGEYQANIITWRITGRPQEWHHDILRRFSVNYSLASKHSALIDFEKKGIEWAIRFSPHYFNTPSECDQFVAYLFENIA